MSDTAIEWTDTTWNPTTGCDRVSPGCDHCYALTMAKRLKGMGSAKYQRDGDPRTSGPGFGITEHPSALDAPLHWRKPRKVFVNSMSDLFHKGVSDEFIARVFAVMAATPQHTYQLLTKRHGRMRSLLGADGQTLLEATEQESTARALYDVGWPLPNLHLGVSVEDQAAADLRIMALLDTPAAVRWLSCEPLLGPVDLNAVGPERFRVLDPSDIGHESGGPGGWIGGPTIDWVVAGGESGPGARPMHLNWARTLRDQCAATGTPFHFKQFGDHAPIADSDLRETDLQVRADGYAWPVAQPHGRADGSEVVMRRVGKKAAGRELDGRTWDEYPAVSP